VEISPFEDNIGQLELARASDCKGLYRIQSTFMNRGACHQPVSNMCTVACRGQTQLYSERCDIETAQGPRPLLKQNHHPAEPLIFCSQESPGLFAGCNGPLGILPWTRTVSVISVVRKKGGQFRNGASVHADDQATFRARIQRAHPAVDMTCKGLTWGSTFYEIRRL
jgi:hypothetical protein